MSEKKRTLSERIAVCETILIDIKADLENHLSHHFWINVALVGAIITEAVGLIILVVRHIS